MTAWILCSGLGWSYPCDIWSVGCILVELCTVWFLWASVWFGMYKYRGSELPRFCRVRRYSRLMKTWNIWLWWRGFSDLCRTICLRGQSMFRTNVVWTSMLWGLVGVLCLLILVCSRHSDKYIRKGRLNWPEGCTSRESMKAVMQLSRLQVCLRNAWQNIHFSL